MSNNTNLDQQQVVKQPFKAFKSISIDAFNMVSSNDNAQEPETNFIYKGWILSCKLIFKNF